MEKQTSLHQVILENKEKLSVTGVTDVDTFHEQKITLFTEDDTLIIEGEGLHIIKLDVANGELMIEGYIDALSYMGNNGARAEKGFFRKILK